MERLQELRNDLLKRGFKNPDAVISMTGLNQYKIDEIKNGGPNEVIKKIKKAVKTENQNLIYKAEYFGYKNFGLAGHVMKMHGPKSEQLLKEAYPDNFRRVAFAIEMEGTEPVKQALSIGIPNSSVGAVAKAINAVGFEKTKQELAKAKTEKEYRNIALGLAEKEREQSGIKLNLYDGVIAGQKINRENFKLMQKLIKKAENKIKTEGLDSISSEKLSNLAQGWKVYNNNIGKLINERGRYSLNEFNILREKLKDSLAAEKIRSMGIKVFPALFKISRLEGINSTSFVLGLYPSEEDLNEIKRQSAMPKKPLEKHFEGTICYARFRVSKGKLIVSNIQSNIANSKLKSGLRKKYDDWGKMLILTLNDYALKMGLNEIWITTAEHQMKQWSELHPKTALEVYGKIPSEMGFKIREEKSTMVEGINSKLFWTKRINLSESSKYEGFFKDSEKTKMARVKEDLLQKRNKPRV